MKKCLLCDNEIPSYITIEGKKRNLCARKYCFECSPFGKHNTKNLHILNVNTRKCASCGGIIKNNASKECCSHKCRGEYKYKLLIERFNKDDVDGMSQRTIKKIMILIHGEKCMECGWHEKNKKTGKVPIELNHKDGNSENNKNKNVELICPNCHSLTPNYKALNYGNGRHKRRQRARDGKSF